MKVTIKDEGELITYDYIEACAIKGIKPLLKIKPHKINTKDRTKSYPVYSGQTTEHYVCLFLALNNLKKD